MTSMVQISFDYDESRASLEAGSVEVAALFAAVPGLRWKIWTVDEASKRAGGIYLFESRELAQGYVSGELVAHLQSQRSNVVVTVSDTIDAAGVITQAPV